MSTQQVLDIVRDRQLAVALSNGLLVLRPCPWREGWQEEASEALRKVLRWHQDEITKTLAGKQP